MRVRTSVGAGTIAGALKNFVSVRVLLSVVAVALKKYLSVWVCAGRASKNHTGAVLVAELKVLVRYIGFFSLAFFNLEKASITRFFINKFLKCSHQ